MQYRYLLILLLFNTCLTAQPELDTLETALATLQHPKTLSFNFYTKSFLRNNEYFNNLYDGITFFGFNIQPYLYYNVNEKTSLSFGIYTRQFFGKEKPNIIDLFYRIKSMLAPNFYMIIGNLNKNHKLLEPILSYDFEYLNNPEKGLQFLYQSKHYNADLWINWQKFILPKDHNREEFLLGYSSNLKIAQFNNLQLYLPIQFLAKHQGGQVYANKQPMQTFFNWTIGLNPEIENNEKKLGFQVNYVQYNDASPLKLLQYIDGYGILSNLYYLNKKFQFELGYWYGTFYYAPVGEPLYQSLSTKYVIYNESEKHLVLLKAYYKLINNDNIFNIYLAMYVDPFRKYYDYSYGLSYSFAKRFRLITVE